MRCYLETIWASSSGGGRSNEWKSSAKRRELSNKLSLLFLSQTEINSSIRRLIKTLRTRELGTAPKPHQDHDDHYVIAPSSAETSRQTSRDAIHLSELLKEIYTPTLSLSLALSYLKRHNASYQHHLRNLLGARRRLAERASGERRWCIKLSMTVD